MPKIVNGYSRRHWANRAPSHWRELILAAATTGLVAVLSWAILAWR